MSHEPYPPTLCIAGPTASGKTALALALARDDAIEIISVDSALVYRGMDIGTAKPGAAELAAVPHHLIDICEPTQAYNAANFAQDTKRLIVEIRARGAHPVLVGGTMLYFKALFDGLNAMPTADPVLRAQIEAEAAQLGWPAMHAQLAQVDPGTAARLNPSDAQRIQRALEVYRSSGRPLSYWHATEKEANNIDPANIYTLISLEPQDRGWLHQRIAQRFDAMLHAGLVDEVTALRQRPELNALLPAMRCVGYRQTWEWLEQLQRDGVVPSADLHHPRYAELRDRAIAATRQLAKRQLTWLRSFAWRQVIACDAANALAQGLTLARRTLHGN